MYICLHLKVMFVCQVLGCLTGAVLLVTKDLSRVGTNVYRVG